MAEDMALFKPKELNDASLTIRMNGKQKDWICRTAKQRDTTVSRFILDLVDGEFQRMQNAPGSGYNSLNENNEKELSL